jgi:hypothetical protein
MGSYRDYNDYLCGCDFIPPAATAPRKDRPRCGAKTRAGGTCMVKVEFGKARCRFHGGLSTGPKSEAGRARIAEAQRRRWRVYREAQRNRQPAEIQPSLEVEAERQATQGHLCGTQGPDHRD